MAKFSIEWTETTWYTTFIEADTLEEARELFNNGDCGSSDQIDSYFEEIRSIEEIE